MYHLLEKEIQIFTNEESWSNEFHLYECGYERCRPGKPCESVLIDYWVIHYCMEGQGYLHMEGQRYCIRQGDLFFIPAFTANRYYPREDNPWQYLWIGFRGTSLPGFLDSCGLSSSHPVLRHQKDGRLLHLFYDVLLSFYQERPWKAAGTALQILDYIRFHVIAREEEAISSGESCFRQALRYIHQNYGEPVTVSEIARAVHVDRTYIFKLFQKYAGISPSQYLQNYRLDKACLLLQRNSLSITEVAYTVGFQQASHFTNVFTRSKGMTPSEYRKSVRNSHSAPGVP